MGSLEDQVELADCGSVDKREKGFGGEQHVAFECPSSSMEEIEVMTRPWFMRPLLWSKLPEELLELIIARLPVAQIDGLRALSKSWRFNMSPHSNFKRLCAEARPKLFALMRADPQRAKIRFKLFDSRLYMWHNCEYSLAREYRRSLSVSDGGLVCFVPCVNGLPILVCNPLTNDWRELPMQAHVRNKPRMIQLIVDKQLGSYKLIIVGSGREEQLAAEVYDSGSRKWSLMNKGYVSGYVDYRLQYPSSDDVCRYNATRGDSLGVYDCGRKRLSRLDCCDDKRGLARLHFAALNDRVFVLEPGHDQSFEIVEFRGPTYTEAQRSIKIPRHTGRGSSLKTLDLNGSQTALHACNGLILVTEGGFCSKHPEMEWRVGYPHNFYLYDMARGTWWSLPGLEKEYDVYAYNARDVSEALMCKLNWWARP